MIKRQVMGFICACCMLFLVACGDQKSQLTLETVRPFFKLIEEQGFTRAQDSDLQQLPLTILREQSVEIYWKRGNSGKNIGEVIFGVFENKDIVRSLIIQTDSLPEKRGNFFVFQTTQNESFTYIIYDEQNTTLLSYSVSTKLNSAEEIKRVKAELDKFK